MNLDINYFCTYDEQRELLSYLINTYSLTVYSRETKKNKDDLFVQSFEEEIKKTRRRVNWHNSYYFSFTKNVEIWEHWIKGEDSISYTILPSEINCNGIDVKACSYEENMILFGRISTIYITEEKINAFNDLKIFMKGQFKKKGRWYISKTILNNPEAYRLIPVVGNLQPKEYDLKIK